MRLDLPTLLSINAAVIIICGSQFVLNTVFRRYDSAGRVWAAAFCCSIITSVSYLVWALVPSLWFVVVVANAAYALTACLLWSGARVYNGRRRRLWVAAAVASIVAAATVVEFPWQQDWAGSVELFSAVGLGLLASAVEAMRRPMGANINARGFSVVAALAGLYFLARAIAFVALGRADPAFEAYFGSGPATYVVTVLMVIATLSLSLVQAERNISWWTLEGAALALTKPLLGTSEFELLAKDRLERAALRGERVVLLAVRLDNLAEINTAFGRSYGDDAIARLAEVVRMNVPASALLCRDPAGAFRAIFEARIDQETDRVVSGIRAALVDTHRADRTGYRLTARVAVVWAPPGATDLDELGARVAAEIDPAGRS